VPAGTSHSLWVFLLPHLDRSPVKSRHRIDKRYDHPDNQQANTARIAVLMCPNSDPSRIEQWKAGCYGGVADYAPLEVNPFLADLAMMQEVKCFEGALPANKILQLADITDGASNTILLAEAGGRPGVAWSSPLIPAGVREVFGGSNGFHRGVSPFCMADSSVRFLSDTADFRLLGRLATRAGGELVGEW
jgi:hypothetical protein